MRDFWIIIAATIATIATRFLPMLIDKYFHKHHFLEYLSMVLPTASFGLLVIYSIKDISFSSSSTYVLLGCALMVIILQYRYNKILLSIFVPTVIYTVFLNFIL